ncbi:glycogen debranching protein [Kribbella solani]|uniref:glycogen debranching protein n=1 Tax=Kribbella solani TaxID=236067 RepID=UPI0029A0F151|nr:glycogen debranching protein [Kribbella solani]MDX3004324.1 glycogen debranching protein [Kribbella solani]
MTPHPTNPTSRSSTSPPRRVRRTVGVALLATATILAGTASALAGPTPTTANGTTPGTAPTQAGAGGASRAAGAAELSETTRLADRRSLVVGDRAYAMGDESGLYPAAGWHVRGEMGGFWTQPIKLLDGLWFGLDGNWLGKQVPAAKYTSGHGYSRIDYSGAVNVRRTDFVPDGIRATLVGLTLSSATAKTVKLDVDAHSELMQPYPWGWTTPSAADANLPDTGAYADGALRFREQGTPSYPNATAHDFAAYVGSSLRPTSHQLGPNHRGPQDPAVICPADGTTPARCDDSLVGKGTGGRLTYEVKLAPGQQQTIWFAVAGSDQGSQAAQREYGKALSNPDKLLRAKNSARKQIDAQSAVDLPGDRLLQQSVEWSKQNLADSVQEARDLKIRDVNEGKDYPAPAGTVDAARWFGAGFPDYPWLFATDGEYTAFAAVAAGQFDTVKEHLRALRDISDILNKRSGKVAHEVTPTGDVYYGSNQSPGNTDETVKFPSTVALLWRWTGDNKFRDEMYDFSVRNLQYVYRELDKDGDGWPEGLANVERAGMGVEKLDSTVYLARGLRDLAGLAASKRDSKVQQWATARATDLESRFEAQWWVPKAMGYADSIDDPANPANDNTPIFQRHWIGVTPMEAMLTKPGQPATPLASTEHARTALDQRETPCYTGEFGLFHTGTGPTSDPAGNPGASCDGVVSQVKSERSIFGLNTSIMAVAEGNFGRLGKKQQQVYTTGNARIQLDPSVWETPGAMPEIAPSPDSPANIGRPFYDRSMALQAWGAYGILWPVVHQQLGVDPDLGNGRIAVVPRLPEGQQQVAGRNVLVGRGAVDVTARQAGKVLTTAVTAKGVGAALTVGAVIPSGAKVKGVSLNGHPVAYQVVTTSRGTQVQVPARGAHAVLAITLK